MNTAYSVVKYCCIHFARLFTGDIRVLHRMTIEIIKLLAATLLAMGVAWVWDKLLIGSGIRQQLRIGIFIPVGEEIIKFVIFNSLHLLPVLFFSLFGLGEGLFESFRIPKRFKITLIVAGSVTHTFFSLFYLTSFPGYLQLLMAISGHILWNYKVLHHKSIG